MIFRMTCKSLVLAYLSLLVGPVFAQTTTTPQDLQQQGAVPDRKPPAVLLGFDTSAPGKQVSVPIILDTPEETRIGAITSEITFSNKLLSFTEARRGLAAELADATINAALSEDETNPENSKLKVVIAAGDAKTLRSGVVANLVFKISQHAPVKETVTLKNAATALTSDDLPAPIDPVTVQDGEILVSATEPVVTACFFYMH